MKVVPDRHKERTRLGLLVLKLEGVEARYVWCAWRGGRQTDVQDQDQGQEDRSAHQLRYRER
jgi:hypothetical protein